MTSGRVARSVAVIAGSTAIVAMVGLTASCAKEEKKTPSTTTSTTPSATPSATPTAPAPGPSPSDSTNPTEKAPRIPTGPNPFSPSVKAPPAPTAIPGDH
jgi:hypothetical protein